MLPFIQPPEQVSATLEQVVHNPTLQSLAICFQENLVRNYSRITISSPGYLCADILQALLDRGEFTDIEVLSTGVRLRQVDDSVVLSMKGESPDVILTNTSLSQVENNLINNMIVNDNRRFFSPETVNRFLSHIMTGLEQHPEKFNQHAPFYKEVVLYILNNYQQIILPKLWFSAVRHCILQSASYADNILVEATKRVILHAANPKNYSDAARCIIESQSNYSNEAVISAAVYIVLNDYVYAPKIILAATKFIFRNADNCSWQLISKATETAVRYSTNCQKKDIAYTALRSITSPAPASEFSNESNMSAALYIVLDASSASGKILCLAIKHIFENGESFSWKIISKAIEVAIRYSAYYKLEDIADTARCIVESPEAEDQPELLISAAIYTVLHNEKYTLIHFSTLAKQIIGKINTHNYSEKLAEQPALTFVNQNMSFFMEPIKNQKGFIDFFLENNEKKACIEDYSEKLKIALGDTEKVELFKVDHHDSKKYSLSILGLWNTGLFHDAIQLDEKIPMFLLSNVEHDAIQHWNSRSNLQRRRES